MKTTDTTLRKMNSNEHLIETLSTRMIMMMMMTTSLFRPADEDIIKGKDKADTENAMITMTRAIEQNDAQNAEIKEEVGLTALIKGVLSVRNGIETAIRLTSPVQTRRE